MRYETKRHLLECDGIGVGGFCSHSEDTGVKCRSRGSLGKGEMLEEMREGGRWGGRG